MRAGTPAHMSLDELHRRPRRAFTLGCLGPSRPQTKPRIVCPGQPEDDADHQHGHLSLPSIRAVNHAAPHGHWRSARRCVATGSQGGQRAPANTHATPDAAGINPTNPNTPPHLRAQHKKRRREGYRHRRGSGSASTGPARLGQPSSACQEAGAPKDMRIARSPETARPIGIRKPMLGAPWRTKHDGRAWTCPTCGLLNPTGRFPRHGWIYVKLHEETLCNTSGLCVRKGHSAKRPQGPVPDTSDFTKKQVQISACIAAASIDLSPFTDLSFSFFSFFFLSVGCSHARRRSTRQTCETAGTLNVSTNSSARVSGAALRRAWSCADNGAQASADMRKVLCKSSPCPMLQRYTGHWLLHRATQPSNVLS